MADGTLYAVFDAARGPALTALLAEHAPDATSLFEPEVDPRLAAVGPYLTPIIPGSPLASRWRANGWGEAWGILCLGPPDPDRVRAHLRSLLRIIEPDGRTSLFRFYDPRVLRAFLPGCEPRNLRGMFGPLTRFHAESEDAQSTITWELRDGALVTL